MAFETRLGNFRAADEKKPGPRNLQTERDRSEIFSLLRGVTIRYSRLCSGGLEVSTRCPPIVGNLCQPLFASLVIEPLAYKSCVSHLEPPE
jgi:hypothetical protein